MLAFLLGQLFATLFYLSLITCLLSSLFPVFITVIHHNYDDMIYYFNKSTF